jgi:hypothetical protein
MGASSILEREHHRLVAEVLDAFDADTLDRLRCHAAAGGSVD